MADSHGPQPSQLEPALAAFQAWSACAHRLGTHPVAVIEGGYFAPRDTLAAERARHLEDSFWLLECLAAEPHHHRPRILLAALVNDFSPTHSYCGIQGCGESSPAAEVASAPPQIPGWAEEIYRRHDAVADCPRTIFSLKNTRNRAGKRIAKTLKRRARLKSCPLQESRDGDLTDILADTDAGPVKVGSWKEPSRKLAVRCTGLMAQHYFDLYLAARERYQPISDLWIFDFNTYLEGDRVRLGAEVSLVLYPWPGDLTLRVVNCIYFPDSDQVTPIRITAQP